MSSPYSIGPNVNADYIMPQAEKMDIIAKKGAKASLIYESVWHLQLLMLYLCVYLATEQELLASVALHLRWLSSEARMVNS